MAVAIPPQSHNQIQTLGNPLTDTTTEAFQLPPPAYLPPALLASSHSTLALHHLFVPAAHETLPSGRQPLVFFSRLHKALQDPGRWPHVISNCLMKGQWKQEDS